MADGKAHILIINQHGENRGDEAAMRAMLQGFEERLGAVRFTLLYQFKDRSLRLKFTQDVVDLPIKLPLEEAARLLLFSATKAVGQALDQVLGETGRAMIRAYETADLVVSAPGGPYFGDIYKDHEIVHWFFVWLAKVYNKPLFLYSPSAGPFKHRVLNPLRKRLYREFDVLCTREEISAGYLRELLGNDVQVHVTADSALQVRLEPLAREEYFKGPRVSLAERLIVAVSAIEYKYPGASDPRAMQRRYDAVMLEVLAHVHEKHKPHFVFLPQLYGKAHSDVPYLTALAKRMTPEASWEVADPEHDSDLQRRTFGMADVSIASRYHPAIFSHSGGTPGVCIYYEHKALAFMRQLELERFAFDIRQLNANDLSRALDDVIENRVAIQQQIETRLPALMRRAQLSSELAVELLNRHRKVEVSPRVRV
jgi:polysaccharide pyruvyl transferase WcaK-like protein